MNPSEKKPSDENRNTGNSGLGDDPWRAMGLVGSVGAAVAVSLGTGVWLGMKVDESQGTGFWMITGAIAGLAVGIGSAILLIRAFTGGRQ